MTARALVIGYGSIGQRHARVLERMGQEVAVVSRRGQDGGRAVYADITTALKDAAVDYVVIANETARHVDSLCELARLQFRATVLVEKPLLASPAALPAHEFARAGVGYNLRFHPAVRALREALGRRPMQMADVYVGQWLPDWRPGRDAKATYSGSRAAGGGALRDLSHELDLVTWLFGPWREVAALGGRHGSVTVDADDGWGILLACERCPVVTVHLNCLDRVPHRTIAVHVDGETLRADLIAASFQTGAKVEAFTLDPDSTYADMHRAVLAGAADVCTLAEGLRTVELIAAVEEAARDRRWVVAAA